MLRLHDFSFFFSLTSRHQLVCVCEKTVPRPPKERIHMQKYIYVDDFISNNINQTNKQTKKKDKI